jgi:monovalent cation:H+ antiporter-2, CPA2 family
MNVEEILLLLVASLATLIFMIRLHLSPVLGYLLIGAVVGHYHLVKNVEFTKHLAEFGVVSLLFVIGLGLTLERLMRIKKYVFGFGGLQILITTGCMTFLSMKLFKHDIEIAVIIGLALSFSSTAIVMQILTETKSLYSQVGRISISALLMQDCAVVPLLAALPILAKSSDAAQVTDAMWEAGLKATAIITLIVVCGRILLRPFFMLLKNTKRDEAYVNAALLIVLGAAWITHFHGLSSAMGAFLAGLLIAETEYRSKIEDSIMPFYGLFLALFFISTGMSIDVVYIIKNFWKVMFLASIVLLVKSAIIFSLCKLFKFELGQSINVSLLLPQCGEFAFILFGLANQQKILDNETTQLLLMLVTCTMAVTPLLAKLGSKLEHMMENKEMIDANQEFKGVSDLTSHIIIVGFGRVGKVIAFMLEQKHIDYIALDSNIGLVRQARMEGYQIYHGDMTSQETFDALGAARASLIVLSTDDHAALRKTVKKVGSKFQNKMIIARAGDCSEAISLHKLGATLTVPETTEVGIRTGEIVLTALGFPEHDILLMIDKMRKDNYLMIEEVESLSSRNKIRRKV